MTTSVSLEPTVSSLTHLRLSRFKDEHLDLAV